MSIIKCINELQNSKFKIEKKNKKQKIAQFLCSFFTLSCPMASKFQQIVKMISQSMFFFHQLLIKLRKYVSHSWHRIRPDSLARWFRRKCWKFQRPLSVNLLWGRRIGPEPQKFPTRAASGLVGSTTWNSHHIECRGISYFLTLLQCATGRKRFRNYPEDPKRR